MVNLPTPSEQVARAPQDRRAPAQDRRAPPLYRRGYLNHGLYASTFGRRRNVTRSEPKTLRELEALASESAVLLFKNYNMKPNEKFRLAMNNVREQYNYSFQILCDNCKGTHAYDELEAPER